MPLMWNLNDSEMSNIRDTNSNSEDNCDDLFIIAVGMSVLNEIGEGYTPTLKEYVLTKELAKKLMNEYLEDSEKLSFSNKEKEQIKNWFPKLVGSSFRRRG